MALDPFGPSAGLDLSQPVAGLDPFAPDPNAPRPLAKGFRGGVAGLKSSLYGAGAAVAAGVGATGIEQSALAAAEEQNVVAAANAQQVEDVDWTSPRSIFDHFQYLLGNAAPSLAAMAAGGITGRILGGLGTRGVASLAARESAKRVGTFLGAVAPDVAMEAGQIYPKALKTGVEDPIARALGGGALAASLDFIPLFAAARYLKAAGRGGAKSFLKGAAKGIPLGVVLEGGQETGQAVIERAAAGLPLTGDEAFSDYLNSFAGGAAPGAVFGAGIGAARGRAARVQEPAPPTTGVQGQPLFTGREQAPIVNEVPVEAPLPGLIPTEGARPDIRDLNVPPVVDTLPAPPDAGEPRVPTEPAYRRGAAPVAADADYATLEALRSQQEAAAIRRVELDAEFKLPEGKRRVKGAIANESRALNTQIGVLNTQIGHLEQQIRNRFASEESAAVIAEAPERTPSTEPVFTESGAFKRPPVDDTTAAELTIARQKQSVGALVSSREAKLLRDAEKTQPKQPAVAVVTENQPRERFKTATPERRAEVIEGVATQSIDRHVAALTAAGGFRQGSAPVAAEALKRVAQAAAKAPTIDAAEKAVYDAAIRALAGRVNKQDAETFAQAVAADVRSAPTFYSKAATESAPYVVTVKPKYPRWNYQPWDVRVVAKSRTDANAKVRRQLEQEGHVFTQSDAATFTAREPTPEEQARYELERGVDRQSRGALAPTKLSDLLAYVPQAARTHAAVGGSSTNLVTGQDLGGTNNYAVSIYKDRELKLEDQPTEKQIAQYVEQNADLLANPDYMLGTWYNPKDGYTYLNVSIVVPQMGEALRLGREHQQIAIFDLRTFTDIDIGHPLFDSAQQYNVDAGMTPIGGLTYKPLDSDLGIRTAKAFDQLPRESTDPAVLASYAAMVQESELQFEYASRVIKIEPWVQEGQPYANSHAMRKDVFENSHLWVFTGGDPHPLITPEQIYKMRAVHDLYGHAQTGFEFGPRGEQNAARAHAQMYSEAAIPAHMTEFFGFTAWNVFSDVNRGKKPSEITYAENRTGLMPEALWRELLSEVTLVKQNAIDQHDLILSDKGQRLVAHLKGMIGEDPNLEVRLFQAAPGEAIGGYTRTDTLKAVISLALNAKGELSVADHEGFHYLEDQVLDEHERRVIERQLRPGTPLFERLLTSVQRYDTENKTNLVDEIISSPQEARAYGYEFWRRGELQVDSALGRIFEKIRQFLERVQNYIAGLGFQSIEDIFQAIDRGQYAQRGGLSVVTEADSDWSADVEPDVISGLRTLHRKEGAASAAKGRPHWVQSGADVARLRARLKKLALEGEVGRQWHAKSAEAILTWAKGDKALAAKMAALIANFSPRTPVGLDLKKAFTAFVQYEAKQTLAPGAPQEHTLGARRILTGVEKDGAPAPVDEAGNVRPTGIKRENFFKNLMLGIDPKNYNVSTQGATIDMWMAHAFDYANDVMGSVTKSQYNYADAEVKRLAKELGWAVEETQAAIWIATKARGNSSRSLMERHALNRGWYEQVVKKDAPTETTLFGEEPIESKRVVKADKQRAFVTEWMRMSRINPISPEQLARANYDYAQAFEDIYAGKIDLSTRLDKLPYAITKPADQDEYELTRQPTLFSRGAIADMDRQMRHGELEREQGFNTAMGIIDAAKFSIPTAKQAFGAVGEEMTGGVARWMMSHITTQNYISRFSAGFRNVYQALSAYTRYKALLISEGSRVQLSKWNTAPQEDITAAFDALLKRTIGGYLKGSAEYNTLYAELLPQQREMFDQANTMVAGFLNRELAADEKTFKQLLGPAEYAPWLANRTAQVQNLIASGYIPERRHGDFTVTIYQDVTDEKGLPHRVPIAHEQYEREAAAIVRAEQYAAEIKQQGLPLAVVRGTRHKTARDSEVSIQQFLDTARRNGVVITQAERERLAKSLTAADSMRRNRLMRRENVPGMSRDGTRVLNEFVVTMANKIAYSEFAPAINAAADGNPVDARTEANVPRIDVDPARNLWDEDGPQSGFYRNKADELTDYVLVPDHTGAWSKNLRGAAMFYFLGGSLAAATVNTMSIPMLTIPALSQYTTYTDAFSTTFGAWKDTWANQGALRDITRLKDKDANPLPAIDEVPGLRAALITAAEDGRTMDTEIHQIMGLSQGGILSKSRNVQRAIGTWMAPFKVAEQTNRITTFIAAYKIGQKNNLNGRALYEFAAGMVDATQNRYDEVNRPAAARNPIWAIMFMFKSFPLFMAEAIHLMYKQNPKSAVYMLLGLTMMSGVQGLPFAEDILDLIDTISQKIFGSPFNSRRAMRNVLKDASEAIVGADLSEVVLRGVVNSVTGMNIASRVGMGDMLPGTRIGSADGDYARTTQQLLGAPVAMVADILKGGSTLAGGVFGQQDFVDSVGAALKQSAPSAVRNVAKGYEQIERGYASDARGRKLVDVSGPNAFWQTLGFTSAGLNSAYEMDKIDRQTLAFYTQVRSGFTEQLTRALLAGDSAKAQETMDAVAAWNTQYPDLLIGFNASTMRRRIVEAGLSLNERTVRLLPKQLRGTATARETE